MTGVGKAAALGVAMVVFALGVAAWNWWLRPRGPHHLFGLVAASYGVVGVWLLVVVAVTR